MFLWLGSNVSQTFLSDVFGVQNIAHVNTEQPALPVIDNSTNKAVRQVLSIIQEERSHTMRVSVKILICLIIFSFLFMYVLFVGFNNSAKR